MLLSRGFFILALILAVFLDTLGLGIITPLLPVYAKSFITNQENVGILIGLLFAVNATMRIFATPFFGKLSDKIGRRKVFIQIGLVIFIISSVGFAHADSYPQLLICRMLQGIGATMFYPIVLSYVAELSPDGKEGFFVSPINTAAFIGMGVGPLMGGYLTDLMEFKYVFYGMGGLCVLGLTLISIFVPESDKVIQKRKRSQVSLIRILKNRAISGIMLYRFLTAFLRGGQMSFLPLLAVGFYQLSYKEIGWVIACNTLLVGLLQGPFGWVADRFPKVKLIIIGNLIGAVALIFMPVSGGFWGLLPLSVCIGIGSAMSFTSSIAIAVKSGKESRLMSSTMSLLSVSMSVGMVFSPMFSGFILDNLGLGMVFPCCGLLVVLGSFGVYYLLKNYSESRTSGQSTVEVAEG